ncbi:DegT/DnrJ/EryC1/StrS family aminotransferase [Aestuariivivens insulae]|uniref:DegT/DnrJ/EryC1/StrS family aminotransferase n=1 Tax=Aestuariivivens insulae TaxID=1621988 RepID=UPI001F5A4298|nr:DegT/DnrJ/EryC1/StrS family aminotransferase [Aestuariivivens insulae]
MIKFLDLLKLNSRFENELKTAFHEFLDSGSYILGTQVSNFEKEFASYCGTDYCVGTSNGLDALELIFEAYKIMGKIRVGDEVIVPANTYIATVLSVSNSGLKPILVEPDIETFNIDPAQIEKVITSKTRAILGVHLYGRLYDVERLEKISKEFGLLLIEDAAQAHGATFFDGRKAGNVSDAAAFSFYPTKNLGALGDAGAVTTNNQELAEIILRLRHYGRTSAYKNDIKGSNCRLDEIQAAFLRVKLKNLEDDNKKRRSIARRYFVAIQNENILLPNCPEDFYGHVYHLYVIRSKKRDALKEHLYRNGIESYIHYPMPIHKQKAYQEWNGLKLSITEQIHNEVLSLPISPIMEKEEVKSVVKVLSEF